VIKITSRNLKVTRLPPSSASHDDLSVTNLVLCLPLALDLVAYLSAMCRRQYSNLFVDELRGSGGGDGAFVACCWPSPGCCGVLPSACLGAQYFLMKARLVGGLMTLLGVTGTPLK